MKIFEIAVKVVCESWEYSSLYTSIYRQRHRGHNLCIQFFIVDRINHIANSADTFSCVDVVFYVLKNDWHFERIAVCDWSIVRLLRAQWLQESVCTLQLVEQHTKIVLQSLKIDVVPYIVSCNSPGNSDNRPTARTYASFWATCIR